jgi:isoquinoline 1-oxidoreductase beta subunit
MNRMNGMRDDVTRREFFCMTAGAVFVYGFHLPTNTANAQSNAGPFAPNAFIRIDEQGVVTFISPQVEMGQGVYTSLSMSVAEELDADWSRVRVEHAPANEKLYVNPMIGVQATGNSNSIRAFWKPLRQAGATTRACLVEAAARSWQVPAAECRTEAGKVIHDRTSRTLDYGALIAGAAAITPPKDAPLKDSAKFRLIGRPLKRLDTPDKTDGRAKYGIDARPPGVKVATLTKSPVLGGKVASVDDRRARAIAGVRQVVVLDDLVAVVADHMWAAKQGLAALDITWNDGPNGDVSTDVIWSRLRAASKRDGAVAREVGRVGEILGKGDVVTAEYEMPLLAHATLEPLNCTVHITPTSAEAWTGTQALARAQAAVAKAANLSAAQVTVHNHVIGGGFGRRLDVDMVYDAARIAKQVAGPVKVVWTREEDIRHDYFRPVYHSIISARLEGGRIAGWKHKISGSAVVARYLPLGFRNNVDPDGVDAAADLPYEIPNYRVEFNREEPPGINTAFWRGVGPNNNVFAIESFIDELARGAGQDPIAFRRAHLDKAPRMQAALHLVKQNSGWGTPHPARHGRGVSAQSAFGTFIATVVECAVSDAGEIELRRVTTAVDAGQPVNPDTIVAQLQGGLTFGLTAALYGEITLQNGRVEQSNFHDYQLLRINQAPPIDVHLIANGEAPGGIGETGTTSAVPALRNAIYAATGVALRRMPIDSKLLVKSART